MAGIPLSWNDPIFSNVTTSSSIRVANGGTVSNKSITDTGDTASIVGLGSFTLDQVRINSQEGVRIAGDGNMLINNSYIETTGIGADHADGIQAYDPGGKGNVTITNSTIVSHNSSATAGMFFADNYGGTVTLNNVVFEGGPYGLRLHADDQDLTVALKDVYFVGPFMYDPFLLLEVNAQIHVTQWENVRYATIVNGQLVPGALIPSPLPVEGGTTTPPVTTLDAPLIASWSPDSNVVGDGITSASTPILKGTSAANATIKVYDGSTLVGTATANSTGAWSVTTSKLSDATHKLTATATNSAGKTSAASAAVQVTVDTIAPTKPVATSNALVNTNHVQIAGTAEANSAVSVRDGTTVVGTGKTDATGHWSVTTSALAVGSHALTATAADAAGNVSAASGAVTSVIATTTPPPTSSTLPTLTIADTSLHVTGGGGTVDLGIKEAAPSSATSASVTIRGLPWYETITDGFGNTFSGGRHRPITLSQAQVNSGLTLTSNYQGTQDPVATLSITANATVGGVTVHSATQTITVIDPPPASASNTAATVGKVALLNQYIASGFDINSGNAPLMSNVASAFGHGDSFLTSPRHA
jgi:hypothetical protein